MPNMINVHACVLCTLIYTIQYNSHVTMQMILNLGEKSKIYKLLKQRVCFYSFSLKNMKSFQQIFCGQSFQRVTCISIHVFFCHATFILIVYIFETLERRISPAYSKREENHDCTVYIEWWKEIIHRIKN